MSSLAGRPSGPAVPAPGAITELPAAGTERKVVIADGTLEALKWLALVLMTIDHINKYLLDWSVPWMFAVGRSAMPIFAMVLAYNLARPNALQSGAYQRTMRHLALGAALSTIPFVALGKVQFAGGWLPLNILATLLVSVAIMYLVARGGAWRMALAIGLFLIGGAAVEFWWFGVALAVSAHTFLRKPTLLRFGCFLIAAAALALVNRNHWALLSLAIVALCPFLRLQVPRLKAVFYAYYPMHLAVLWVARSLY